MKLAILPRYIDLDIENSAWNKRHYIVHNHVVMAREMGIGLCAIMSPYECEEICSQCDGLIVPGSSNAVDPVYYGKEPMNPPAVFDEFELDLKLMDYFIKNNKPVFGICAGQQALNIYFGGTIGYIQTDREHYNVTHSINIKKDSFVYDVYKSEKATVNSYHVMCIEKLGKGLDVVATSEDGIIEAVENKEKRVFATQWHPERSFLIEDSFEKKFFENFIEACRK